MLELHERLRGAYAGLISPTRRFMRTDRIKISIKQMAASGEGHPDHSTKWSKSSKTYELWLLSDRVLLARPERAVISSPLISSSRPITFGNMALSWIRPTHRANDGLMHSPESSIMSAAEESVRFSQSDTGSGGQGSSSSLWLCLEDAVFTGTAPLYEIQATTRSTQGSCMRPSRRQRLLTRRRSSGGGLALSRRQGHGDSTCGRPRRAMCVPLKTTQIVDRAI